MKTESSDLFVMKMIYRLSDEASKLETAQKLASELNISPEKALNVLNRYPGPLIKPMSRQRVEEIANSFIRVGVPVEVIAASAQVSANPPSATPSSPQPKPPAREAPISAPIMEPLGIAPFMEPSRAAPASFTPISVAPSMPTMAPLTSGRGETGRGEGMQQPLEPMGKLEETPTAPMNRTSLRTKLVASSLVPMLFIGISSLSVLSINVPHAINQLDDKRVHQLAAAVMVPVNPSDPLTEASLRGAVLGSAGDIGFIQITTPSPSGKPIFVTKDPQLDGLIQQSVVSFLASPAAQVADPVWHATTGLDGDFYVLRGQVFQLPSGQRVVHLPEGLEPTAPPKTAGTKLFDFALGNSQARVQSVILQQIGLMAALIGLTLISATVLALIFSRSISGAIIRLTTAADTISLGEFDVPVERKSNDELGDLAESLDRMRISLRSALERLRRRR